MTASSRKRFFFRSWLCGLLGLLLLFPPFSPVKAEHPKAPPITNYQAVHFPFLQNDGRLGVAIRQYRQSGEERLLVLDPERFQIEVCVRALADLPPASREAWRASAFAFALERHTAPPYPLQNDGLRHAESPVAGFFLTADLCPSPSRRPLDRLFLEALASLPLPKPIPLALMVSGRWIEGHGDDMIWIKEQIAAGKLAVTWVNHSYSHFYNPQLPLEENFLLHRERDFRDEVLLPEQRLLAWGLLPSPFFRFPGLVSDSRLVMGLRELTLIPIGADAWLAKGETPRLGSIILVHANGSEPEGIRLLQAFLASQNTLFLQRQSRLLPLTEAFAVPPAPTSSCSPGDQSCAAPLR